MPRGLLERCAERGLTVMRNPTGKLDKVALRREHTAGEAGPVVRLDHDGDDACAPADGST